MFIMIEKFKYQCWDRIQQVQKYVKNYLSTIFNTSTIFNIKIFHSSDSQSFGSSGKVQNNKHLHHRQLKDIPIHFHDVRHIHTITVNLIVNYQVNKSAND